MKYLEKNTESGLERCGGRFNWLCSLKSRHVISGALRGPSAIHTIISLTPKVNKSLWLMNIGDLRMLLLDFPLSRRQISIVFA